MDDDTQALVDRLNEALAFEYQSVIMYTTYAATVDGINRGELREFFQDEIPEEQAHAQFLADKISALGGEPIGEPAGIKHVEGPKDMLEQVLHAEKEAVYRYVELRDEAETYGDFGLVNDLEDIISDETRHKEETEKLLRGDWVA